MTVSRRSGARPLPRRGLLFGIVGVGLLATHVLFAGQGQPPGENPSSAAAPVPALSPYIEAHAHFDEHDLEGSVRAALDGLRRQNAAKIFFQAPPDTFEHQGHFDIEGILPLVKQHPDTLAVLGGGGTLNAMIQQSVASNDAGPDVRKTFKDRAEELLRDGVVGFGEMTAEHFAGGTPYQYAPADHPLFLLLADIAAEHGVPIDLHMEAVLQTMALPAGLTSPPNAPQLQENIKAFERLLAHNPRTAIIWAHGGSDATGDRTPNLSRRLLQAHPNLYIEIKTDPQKPGKNYPLVNDRIKPEWLKLLGDFPDRFIVGTDQHYPEPKGQPQRWQTVVLLLNQLPPDLRRKVGTENVLRIYAAKPTGSKTPR